jgi:hypothetical protein
MSTLSVRLPNSLHDKLRALARQEGTSINQFISSAVAEKLAALLTEELLETRAQRGTRGKFNAVLRAVPDVEPDANDRLPNSGRQPARRTVKPKRK